MILRLLGDEGVPDEPRWITPGHKTPASEAGPEKIEGDIAGRHPKLSGQVGCVCEGVRQSPRRCCNIKTTARLSEIWMTVFVETSDRVSLPRNRYAPIVELIWRGRLGIISATEPTFDRIINGDRSQMLSGVNWPVRPTRKVDLGCSERISQMPW